MWTFICLSINTQAQETKKVKVNYREQRINEYYMMADSCFNCDDYINAIKYANKGIELIKNRNKNKVQYYELKEITALTYMNTQEYELALSIFHDLESIGLDSEYIAYIYYYSSRCYSKLANWSHAIMASEKCLEIMKEWHNSKDLVLEVSLNLADLYAKNGNYEEAEKLYLYLKDDYYNLTTSDYYSYLIKIRESFKTQWYSSFYLGILLELTDYFRNQYDSSKDYCIVCSDLAYVAQNIGYTDIAYKAYIDALNSYAEIKETYSNDIWEYNTYLGAATCASELGEYDKAYSLLNTLESIFSTYNESLYEMLIDDFKLHKASIIEESNHNEAVGILTTLLECKTAKSDASWKSHLLHQLSSLIAPYNRDDAVQYIRQSISLSSKDVRDVRFAGKLQLLATLLMDSDTDDALKYFEICIDIYKRYTSGANYNLLLSLKYGAECALSIGELGRTIAWGEEARNIQKECFTNMNDWRIWELLLDAYSRLGNNDSYERIYNEYRELSDNGRCSVDFALREFDNLAYIGKIEDAIDYLRSLDNHDYDWKIEQTLKPIATQRFDVCMHYWGQPGNEGVFNTFAYDLIKSGEYNAANLLLKSTFEKYKHSTKYLCESIGAAYVCGDDVHCKMLIDYVVEHFRRQLKAVVGMSTNEKYQYWTELSEMKNIVAHTRKEIENQKQLYNIALTYKNFLLNSDVTFLRTLEYSKDEKLKGLADELRKTKNLLAYPITQNVDSLKLREIEINRNIIQNLKDLSDFEYASNVCCDSIATALLPNEVAIEIADYSTNNGKFYVAMILRKDWIEPILVELGDESKFFSLSNMPIKKLYDPHLPFSTELYELIWKPLIPYLNKSDVIYISPSGILSTLAIEALSSDDGIYVSELYNIKRVTSTAYILEDKSDNTYESACIFGGVLYDSDINGSFSTEVATWDSGYLLDRYVYEDIPYLPGTKKEAEILSGIFTNSKSDVTLHIGADANEYVFKDLSGTSPEIIHIATHGFYIPKKERNSYRYYADNTASLAMERSGLMLAGANDAWNGKLTPGIEDGILTASEISKLDLSRTNLVVMSACETGLGDITEDGIEGLQRAFKSAGVETLVMSLWKVDDKATEMLMEEFYKLLIKGYSKDDAFQSAKAKVRSKKSYSSPYYWASFIMLD